MKLRMNRYLVWFNQIRIVKRDCLKVICFVVVGLLLVGCVGNGENNSVNGAEITPAGSPTTTQPTPTTTQPTPTNPQPTPTNSLPTPTNTQPPATNITTADADVTYVSVTQQANGTWSFTVTVSHPDTGWDDYADGWDIVLPDGTIVKINEDDPFTRLLAHPHENEQPFTRSQSNLTLPDDVRQVVVRAHDLVDGFGGQEVAVDLMVETGENFEVHRP